MSIFDVLNKIFPPKTDDPTKNVGRNDACWCGSGKKYKVCHLPADDRKRSRNGG